MARRSTKQRRASRRRKLAVEAALHEQGREVERAAAAEDLRRRQAQHEAQRSARLASLAKTYRSVRH